MKKKHAFQPSMSNKLEDRVVLSNAGPKVVTAFTQFERKLTAELKTATGVKGKADVVTEVNKLGDNLVHILGNNNRTKTLVRETITGAPDPNGISFVSGPTKGSLLAALSGKKPKIGPAISNAEIKILSKI